MLTLLIPNRLVHAQDQAAGLHRRLDGIDLDETWLPHECVHVVPHALVVEIYPRPDIAFAMLHAQPVEDVGRVEAGIVTQLTGDDLERFGKGFDDRLLPVGDVLVREPVQIGGDFHLECQLAPPEYTRNKA